MKASKLVPILFFFLLSNCYLMSFPGEGTGPFKQMMYIPEGSFTMGLKRNIRTGSSSSSSGETRDYSYEIAAPLQKKYLPAFYIDKYEVTQQEYQTFIQATGHQRPHYFKPFQYPQHPVIDVSYKDCQTFCQWSNKQICSEAQWEKAARGTDGRSLPWGNKTEVGCDYTVKDDDRVGGNGCGTNKPMNVGSKSKDLSPYGVFDLAGNVSEWVNGKAPEGEACYRGGDWSEDDSRHSARRYTRNLNHKSDTIGCRCCAKAP